MWEDDLLRHVVVNWDADTPTDVGGDESRFTDSLETAVKKVDTEAKPDANRRRWTLGEGNAAQTTVSLVVWKTDDEPASGLPQKQTLERLVSAAIREAYPERAEEVHRWLRSRTDPPEPNPKDYSWSYMAGWNSEAGCESFLAQIWKDELVAASLKTRLEASGAWDIALSLTK